MEDEENAEEEEEERGGRRRSHHVRADATATTRGEKDVERCPTDSETERGV